MKRRNENTPGIILLFSKIKRSLTTMSLSRKASWVALTLCKKKKKLSEASIEGFINRNSSDDKKNITCAMYMRHLIE
jgi:hypothetical protein